ncbi:hypothetical protein AXA44_09415 [Rhodococcus sp. SC4]|nr:hypothetical protein AXA44_09415 [Rhodococcus sp. SC4]
MSELTVFLAPRGIAEGVKDVLKDLSAAQLIEPFIWIDDDGAAKNPVEAVRVERGSEYDTTLQEVVSTHRIDVLRLGVLVPVIGGEEPLDTGVERRIAELATSTSGGARVVRVRLLLARPGSAPTADAVCALDGWHNVLVAPEDARGPGMGHVALGPATGPADLGRFAAPVVAGVTGLWSDVEHAPLDDKPVLPGHLVRIARSFYRRLDTSVAEDSLRGKILAQEGGFPLPRENGAPVTYINDVALATRSMADALWRKHAGVLRGPRLAYEVIESQRVGFWDALRMFFSFLWAALRNAPSAWYARVVNSVSTGVANAVHATVFGAAPSAYEVVVKGRTSQGDRASWSEIGYASEQLGGTMDSPGDDQHHAARVDLSDLWQDYSRAALTLADAGARSADLPPVQVGASRGILRGASDAVPGPSDRFDQIPGIVAATVGTHSVDATDTLGIRELRDKLGALDQDPNIGLEARRTGAALDEWQRRGSNSFGVAVGQRIAGQFYATFQEVRELLARLRAAGEEPVEGSRRHKTLARWAQLTFALLVLVIAVSAVAIAQDWLVWWQGALVILTAIVLWIVGLVIVFMRSQQELFQQLNKRKKGIADLEVDQANLRSGLRDLDRLAGAYSQYLVWSRALGAFLAEPLGPDEVRTSHDGRIAWGLPKSTAIGYASPHSEEVSTAAEYLRQDLFGMGWLTSSWERLLGSAGKSLGIEGRDIAANPAMLWSEAGSGSGSPLERWSAALFAGTVTSTGAALMWDKARANLLGPKSELVRSLVGTIDVEVDGMTRSTSIDDFIAGVGEERPSGRADHFDRGVLTDSATTGGLTAVKDDVRHRSYAGIGSVSVVTQFSDGLSVDNLQLAPAAVADAQVSQWDVPAFPTAHAGGSAPSGAAGVDSFEPPRAEEGFRF